MSLFSKVFRTRNNVTSDKGEHLKSPTSKVGVPRSAVVKREKKGSKLRPFLLRRVPDAPFQDDSNDENTAIKFATFYNNHPQ